jgi:hypothetical protein
MAIGEHELQVARDLFNIGWSGDDPHGPTRYMTPDVRMRDIAMKGGPEAITGHEAIVNRWKHVAGRMRLPVEDVFVNPTDDSVVVQWFVYVLHVDGEHAGQWDMGEGNSMLRFRDGLVSLEVDFWHGRQGRCADWQAHFAARQALGAEERGRVSGYWLPS